MLRTAKSCGPDAPTLASSLRRHVGPTGLRQPISADDGGKQARSPGRARRKPLKPLRAGMPGDPGGPVVNTRVLPTHCTRGCGCIGHPAFPTPSLGRKIPAQLGRIAPRECGGARQSLSRHRPRKRTIQYSRGISDRTERPQRTGYPACAGYDSAVRTARCFVIPAPHPPADRRAAGAGR